MMMEIFDIKNGQDIYGWLQQFDWGSFWDFLIQFQPGLSWSSAFDFWGGTPWWIHLLIIIAFAAVISKYIGPPWKKVEPGTMFFLSIFGQPLPWGISNSDFLHFTLTGNLVPGRGILGWLFGWITAYRIVPFWPLFYVSRSNRDGTKPQKPLVIKPESIVVVTPEAELKGDSGAYARTVTVRLTYWFMKPRKIIYGGAPINWREAFEDMVIGETTNIAKGFTDETIENKGALQKAIRKALVARTGILNWLFGWIRRRPADIIAKELGIGIVSVSVLNIERPPAYVDAATIIRNGKANAYVADLLNGVQLKFARGTESLSDRAVALLKYKNIGTGSIEGDESEHRGGGLELLTPMEERPKSKTKPKNGRNGKK